ncbi:MAG: His/Gly/Thr/Pro-type tRNA ligase C-terminal domain-containing protein, partial [Bacilli bacterium]
TIRVLGYSVDVCFDNIKMGNMFKRAEKKKAKYAIIIGENEMNNGEVIIKDLASKEQMTIKQEELEDKVVELLEGETHECTCGCHDEHHDENCHCHEEKK